MTGELSREIDILKKTREKETGPAEGGRTGKTRNNNNVAEF